MTSGSKAGVDVAARLRAGQRKRKGPLYAALAQDLLNSISSGKYPVGSLLPTELELAELHRVSRQTVREAFRQLSASGMLLRQPGIGTLVHSSVPTARYTHSINSFSDLEQYASDFPLVINRLQEVTACGGLAHFIGCREGSRWLMVLGVRHAVNSDTPFVFSENYINDCFPQIRDHLKTLHGTVHALLERHYGERIEEMRQQIHAISLPSEIAEILHVPARSPGLEIRRRFFGAGGRLIMSGRAVYPGDSYHHSVRFLRDEAT
jgi:GntR family transcriptional regulator